LTPHSVKMGWLGGDDFSAGENIVLDSTGNIYVTGYSDNADHGRDMTVWKYRSNGTLDSSFSGDGILVLNYNDGTSGNSIAVDSTGHIYVTGYIDGTVNRDMMTWKFKSDGTPDNSFDGNGIVRHNSAAGGDGIDVGNDMVLDSIGNIYVTGNSDNADDSSEMVIWKYKSDGTLDATFDGDGVIASNAGLYTLAGDRLVEGTSIAMDGAGNVYVTGHGQSGMNRAMVIWKYQNDGTPDVSFDGDGIVIYDLPDYNNDFVGESIVLDSAGNIYITGSESENWWFNTNPNMIIWKYK